MKNTITKGILTVIGVILLLIFTIGLLSMRMREENNSATEINLADDVMGSENIISETKEIEVTKESEQVEVKEEGDTIEDEKTIEPTIIAVISEDSNKDIIIMEAEEGKQASVEIGVQEIGDGQPDLADTIESKNNQSNPEISENIVPSQGQNGSESSIVENDQPREDGYVEIPDHNISYQEYEMMSGDQQMLFYYSFANAEEFTKWYNKAKAEYEEKIDKVYIGLDGVVNAEKIN